MISIGTTCIIPIGCSCITQFQIEKHFGRTAVQSSFFDWMITAPGATIALMTAQLDGTLAEKMADRTAYNLHSKCRYMANAHFPGLYFWHEKGGDILAEPAKFAAFLDKMQHLFARSFMPPPGHAVHLIWSNLQPNLKIVTARVTDNWAAFCLSSETYAQLTEVTARLYPGAVFHVVANPDDCDPALANLPNVYLIDLERSAKYIGPKGLYKPVFEQIPV